MRLEIKAYLRMEKKSMQPTTYEANNLFDNCSVIVLSGGKSRRMGQDKASLLIGKKKFIQHIVEKLKEIGFKDILLCSYPEAIDGARNVEDIFIGKGPLSGIHAGMSNAKNPDCLVISADTPLVPKSVIKDLVKTHAANSKKATVLEHNGNLYPVLGVYKTDLLNRITEVLGQEKFAIKKILDGEEITKYPYNGEALLIAGCNTPEEYKALINVFKSGKDV